MPKLNRILETSIYVDDLERAARFYETVMQLTPLLKTRTLFAYDVGGANVLLIFKRGASLRTQTLPGGTIPPHDGAGPLHICFAVDQEALAWWDDRLAQHDVVIEGRTTWERGGQSSYFRDPDGHLLELMTPGNWTIY
ncbi:VOC family protein [Phreatobacter stygius]|uniref:Glyoxalase n=1 Tax=Phreatobacter stygius TaxID=1940610 RepID=A0A4D7BCY5_9HYPH|nr:VOC family protein [Phreatobacter stygius]QCI67236.1 glyoxalase [Phreatobacter stygius]